jgi:hypothetical protein
LDGKEDMNNSTMTFAKGQRGSSNVVEQEQRGASLGTLGRISSGQDTSGFVDYGSERWQLQTMSRKLLPDEAVATCLRNVIDGVSCVSVVHVPATQSAHYAGLQTCGSVWVCPVCGAKITERRKKEIEDGMAYARSMGLRVVMLTYTFKHAHGDILIDMLDAMTRAFASYRSGRPYSRLKRAFGVEGYIRALEVTYGDANGWHPHVHELVFLNPGVDIKGFGDEARRLWENAAARHGLSMNEHGFDIEDCDDKIAAYIAKFGQEPSEKTQQAYQIGWNEASELAKWHIKKGKAATLGQDEHVTPFGLLRYAAGGDTRAGWLFQEYARCFKGRHQLQWSRGLKEKFGLVEKTDEELAAEEDELGGEVLIQVSRPDWAIVVANDARYELLQVAKTGDIEQIAVFLAELGVERASYNEFGLKRGGQRAC